MLRTWPALLLAVAACSNRNADDTTLEPADSDVPIEECEATIASTSPADAAYDVELGAAVVAVFSEPITAAMRHDFVVRHTNTGADIEGEVTLASNGLSATFTPHEPLLSHSTYDVTARVCSDVARSTFDTVSLPADVATLEGRTWAVDMSRLKWVQPQAEGMSDSVAGELFLHVLGADPEAPSMEVVVGTGVQTGDDLFPDCPNLARAPTTDLSANPELTVGPITLVVHTSEGPLRVQGLNIDAVLTSDASLLLDVSLHGFLAPSELLPGTDCDILAWQLSGSCAPCPSGQGDCLVIELWSATAAPLPLDLDLVCPS